MQTQRLFEILYLLLQKRKTTAKELADHFEVSVRTIYRDLDVLTLAGIPLYTTKGKHGGIFLMEDYILNKGILSDEEQQKILSALRSQQIADKEDVSELLTKLSGVFQKPDTPWIAIDFSDWSSTEEDQQTFSLLKESILSHRVLCFQYHDSYGAGKERTVEPLQLLFKGQAWYLVAYCKTKKAQRTFKIKRMRKLVLLHDRFERTMEPVSAHYHQYQTTQVSLTLHFDESMAYRVYEEYPSEQIQREKEGLLVQTMMAKGEMLYGILLSYGAGLKVLEPAEIGAEVSRRAKQIQEIYNT